MILPMVNVVMNIPAQVGLKLNISSTATGTNRSKGTNKALKISIPRNSTGINLVLNIYFIPSLKSSTISNALPIFLSSFCGNVIISTAIADNKKVIPSNINNISLFKNTMSTPANE